ncbi:MAG: FkbM family methyltransferase [Clostridia bacterium]|nr:FkbM family methyltransferase [Clostridia bacterium]
MNYIDKEFTQLTNTLEKLTLDDIFYIIKNNYLKLNNDMKTSLEDYFKRFNYWGSLDHKNNDYTEIYEKAKSLKENLEDYKWLYNKLEDYRSKNLLFAILNNFYKYDFKTLEQSRETNYKDYFDLDLIKCENETIVDLGAYIGDTTLDYINTFGIESYKKIYCYEITPHIFAILKENLVNYPNITFKRNAVSDKKETMYISNTDIDPSANRVSQNGDIEVEAVTLDEDIKEKITILKMDIEGYEQKAILGSKNHIKNDKPALLISVYHNNEDLWKIPRMIEEICPGYKFYLRNNGGGIFPTEITLIGIYNSK